MKTYYKVCNIRNTLEKGIILGSVRAPDNIYEWGKIYSVEYIPFKYITTHDYLAKDGYFLLVFDSIENAENFIFNNRLGVGIFECKIKEKIKKLPPAKHLSKWPSGTVMAKRVKLIGIVKKSFFKKRVSIFGVCDNIVNDLIEMFNKD